MSVLNAAYDPAHYVILLPNGTPGFNLGMTRTDGKKVLLFPTSFSLMAPSSPSWTSTGFIFISVGIGAPPCTTEPPSFRSGSLITTACGRALAWTTIAVTKTHFESLHFKTP